MPDPTAPPGPHPDPDRDPDRDPDPGTGSDRDALIAALIELERHVSAGGWDAPPRLFALVRTDDLISAEPELARRQGLRGSADGGFPDALSAIEQDEFAPTGDLVSDLSAIAWPEAVHGCAVSLESTFLTDPDQPHTEDIRLVTGVTRAGSRHGVARLVSQPDELLASDDLVPELVTVLAHTLAEPDSPDGSTEGPDGGHPAGPDDRRTSHP